jgi:hypothetical protein
MRGAILYAATSRLVDLRSVAALCRLRLEVQKPSRQFLLGPAVPSFQGQGTSRSSACGVTLKRCSGTVFVRQNSVRLSRIKDRDRDVRKL